MKALCDPASATQATIPSQPPSGTKPNPTDTKISQIVQATNEATKKNQDTSPTKVNPADKTATTTPAAKNNQDTSTTKSIPGDKTATQPSTKQTVDSAICGEVLLGRMKQAKMSNADIMNLCHK